MPLLFFTHANSYGASTYRLILEALKAKGYLVEAPDQLAHQPQYPVTNNWPHVVQELAILVTKAKAKHGQTPILIGHSMGGSASLLLAIQQPDLARGLILMDSFVLSGLQMWITRIAKFFNHTINTPPASVALRRRNVWSSTQEVMDYLHSKKQFKAWHPQVLQDYAMHGTIECADAQGTLGAARTLKFKREIEAQIYATFPDHIVPMMRQRPLHCPFHFVGGIDSNELRLFGTSAAKRIVAKRAGNSFQRVAGSHLFPMEHPLETADLIDQLVQKILRQT